MTRPGRMATRDWERLRLRIFQRDDWSCVECGGKGRLECDHVTPLADGGTDEPANLRTLCRDCHITLTAARNTVHHVRGQRDWERLMAMSPGKRRRQLWR